MLEEYLNEIIAAAVFILIFLLYSTIRSKLKNKNSSEKKVAPKIINDPYDDPYDPYEVNNDTSNKETNDTNPISTPEEEVVVAENTTSPARPKRFKIEVPEHGKITKENFQEFAGVKILLAEDNIINQKVIKGLLAGSGIEITIANDGLEAMNILKDNDDFQVILMDVHMPNMDGFEATRQIRANPKYEHIVVVSLSGDVASDDLRKMAEAGMEENLEKPLKVDAFYDILYAYTKNSDENSKHAELLNSLNFKELNAQKGLEICANDQIFYTEILNQFSDSYQGFIVKIKEYLTNNAFDKIENLLLDFIGMSANVGADNAKNKALDLQVAIKNSEEQMYEELIDDLEVLLKVLLKEIDIYQNRTI